MRKFSFRLDPILDLKESLERAAQVELGKLQSAHRDAVAELKQLIQHRIDQLDQLGGHQRQLRLNVGRIENHLEYLTQVEQRIRQQEEVVQELAQRVMEQREKLVACMKEKKVLLKLKERHKATHDGDVAREEEQQTDEVVTTRQSRGRVMGGG